MAGILEVTNKAEKEATKLWTVVPEASDAPPETRSGASVDDMLAMAAVYLGVAATAVKPIVLLPAGFGRGTVVGDDAVVLLVDGALNGAGGGGDRTNRRASLLASAAGRLDGDVRGAAVVGRLRHDLGDPLAVGLGAEAAPALLSERCWLVAAREANGAKPASSFAVTPGATGARTDDVAKPAAAVALDPKTGLPAPLAKKRAAKPAAAAPARPAPPPFPAAACRDVLEQLLAARAAEMDRRAAPAGRSVAVVPGTAGAVRWANANDKVHVSAQLAEGTKRGHVRVDISATRLAVKVGALVGGDFKLATLLDGALFQDVDPAASSWTLVDTDLGSAELQVTLAKKVPMRWLMLVRS